MICSDKTGSLTTYKMVVTKAWGEEKRRELGGEYQVRSVEEVF